jgi:hypothetical protein
MKRFILRTGIWGLGLAASLAMPLAQARDCGCNDLPAMIQELTEYEYMQKLFKSYADYMPYEIQNSTELKDRAQAQLNAAFYSGAVAGTTHGAHAALGTDIRNATCPILSYVYDKKGNKVLNKDGTPKLEAVTEKTYRTSQCSGRTRADFAHEQSHVDKCRELVKNNKTHLWDRLTFFAQDDADAYRAGADVLRTEIKTLASTCGWESSTKNRLPDFDEAHELVKKAAKARPARRKKKS